jgi:hypothetical protein
MIDFTPLRNKQNSLTRMSRLFTPLEFKNATSSLFDHILTLIEGCADADVTFEPEDPLANDPYTIDPSETNLSWTLGHVIVHLNASLEESAFLAAELARGVEYHGRSRYEVPWRSVVTIEQCRGWLEQCRRLCLASLEIWPDLPHYENAFIPWKGVGKIDARGRYLLGLKHADDHLGQIAEIVRQAKAVRGSV